MITVTPAYPKNGNASKFKSQNVDVASKCSLQVLVPKHTQKKQQTKIVQMYVVKNSKVLVPPYQKL